MGKIGSTLAGAGKFVGANAAMIAMFSLLGPYIDRLVNGGGEQGGMPEDMMGGGPEAAGGMTEADLLEMMAQMQRPSSDQGMSAIERMLGKQELQSRLAGSQGAVMGSSFNMPRRTISPELLALTQGYDAQIGDLSQSTPPSFAQLMAQQGYYQ